MTEKLKFDKDDKLLASLQLEEFLLTFEDELVELKVEERRVGLKTALCDKCIYKLFAIEKLKLLKQKLAESGWNSIDKKYILSDKLTDKLVVDNTKQCIFCISKLFDFEKDILYRECYIFLLAKNYAIQRKVEERMTIKEKFFLFAMVIIFSLNLGNLLYEIFKRL
jgi:hypothetical protein